MIPSGAMPEAPVVTRRVFQGPLFAPGTMQQRRLSRGSTERRQMILLLPLTSAFVEYSAIAWTRSYPDEKAHAPCRVEGNFLPRGKGLKIGLQSTSILLILRRLLLGTRPESSAGPAYRG
eukprot:6183366-Pleurochrysis_carterae.AAC.7